MWFWNIWEIAVIKTTFCCCSVAKSRLTLWYSKDCSTSDFLGLHYLLELAQLRVQWVSCAIYPSHPLLLLLLLPLVFPRVFYQWVSSSNQVAKVPTCYYHLDLVLQFNIFCIFFSCFLKNAPFFQGQRRYNTFSITATKQILNQDTSHPYKIIISLADMCRYQQIIFPLRNPSREHSHYNQELIISMKSWLAFDKTTYLNFSASN